MFTPIIDEQIVTMALMSFLNALMFHFGISCHWIIHRKRFRAKLIEASFEARTDGYLDDYHQNAYAFIEVKPVI